MAIDKRINFRGGGMDMGNVSNQARSASMGNTTSRSTSPGTGGSSGNLGGGGGGQNSDYRRYSPPVAPTYTSANIDQKPITGADFQRSENEFIDNLNRNNAARFEPSFFNRTYQPVTLDQIGSRNQLPNYSNVLMGGILGLINPLAGRLYSGYNYLQNNVPQTLNTFKQSPTLMDFYNNMRTAPVNNTIDIREKFNRTGGLSGIESIQTVGSNDSNIESLLLPGAENATGLTIAELQALINNASLSNTQGSS